MSSESSLSWHTTASTAESTERIDIDDEQLIGGEIHVNNQSNSRDNINKKHSIVTIKNSDKIDNTTVSLLTTGSVTKSKRKHQQLERFSRCATISQRIRQVIAWKVPWIIILISVVQIVLHYAICTEKFNALLFTPTKKHDLWRFITYHSVHSGSTHLFLNVILQIFVATPLETEQGHFRVFLVYYCGVIFGAIGSAIINPTQAIVGASAGVYSLLLSHVSHCILNWSTLSKRIFRIVAVVVLCGSDTVFIVGHFMYRDNFEPKISLSAHAGGALAGCLCGFAIFSKNKELNSKIGCYCCKNRWFAAILLFGILLASVIYLTT